MPLITPELFSRASKCTIFNKEQDTINDWYFNNKLHNAVRSGKSEESFYDEIKFQSFLHLKMSYKKCQIQIETFCFAES